MSPLASTFAPLAASAVKLFASAASTEGARKIDGAAPVTATRTEPSACLATKTPTNAKREAGLGNLAYAACFGSGKDTAVTIPWKDVASICYEAGPVWEDLYVQRTDQKDPIRFAATLQPVTDVAAAVTAVTKRDVPECE